MIKSANNTSYKKEVLDKELRELRIFASILKRDPDSAEVLSKTEKKIKQLEAV